MFGIKTDDICVNIAILSVLIIAGLLLIKKYIIKFESFTDIDLEGRCGPDYKNQTCPEDNPCCNRNGWCGSGDSYCSIKKNQSDFNYKK